MVFMMRRENNNRGSNASSNGRGNKFGPGNRSSGSDRSSDNNRSGGNSRFGGNSGSNFGGGQGRSFNSTPREMHKTVCAQCNKECEVPFKPTGERPVYCRDCFAKNKPADRF